MPDPQLQLTLIGPWCRFDPADPLAGVGVGVGVEHGGLPPGLTGLGWLAAPPTPNATLALAATMIEPDPDPEVVPLFASLFVHEHHGRIKAELTAAGEIIPRRRRRMLSLDWPTPDVGTVEFSQLSYQIPLPRSDRYYTVAFATPNLTRLPELDYVFDAIVSTATWIEPDID